MSMNDNAASEVIGVILMIAIMVILAGVIAAFVFGMGENIKHTSDPTSTSNSTFTIVDKTWDGNDDHWGYVTVSDGSAYHVKDGIEYMKLQINHTYNVDMDFKSWGFPVITKVNYEVMP